MEALTRKSAVVNGARERTQGRALRSATSAGVKAVEAPRVFCIDTRLLTTT